MSSLSTQLLEASRGPFTNTLGLIVNSIPVELVKNTKTGAQYAYSVRDPADKFIGNIIRYRDGWGPLLGPDLKKLRKKKNANEALKSLAMAHIMGILKAAKDWGESYDKALGNLHPRFRILADTFGLDRKHYKGMK